MRTKLPLHWQILLAVLLAVVAGLLTGKHAGLFGVRYYDVYGFFGTLFLNALKMLIVPLVMASIITGMANIGGDGTLGRLGVRTLVYYLTTSLIAILIGLALVNLFTPAWWTVRPPGRNSGSTAGRARRWLPRSRAGAWTTWWRCFCAWCPPTS